MTIIKGTVLWYDIKKGYGFIRCEDGNSVFIHKTEVPFWSLFLNKGDKVEFISEPTVKGERAVDVKVI